MGEKIYYDQGQTRKNQIARWTLENIRDEGLQPVHRLVKKTLAKKDISTAYKIFKKNILLEIISRYENEGATSTLGYILQENVLEYGEVVFIDLFSRIYGVRLVTKGGKVIKSKIKNAEDFKIRDIIDKVEQVTEIRRFGYNTKGKKEEVIVRIVIDDKTFTPKYIFQSRITGEFIRPSKALQEDLNKRQNGNM